MAYCTRADLENAVGGAARLRQLADFNRTDNPNDAAVVATISGWLEDEAATIRSKVEVKHDPETLANLDAASRRKLADANATLSARTAHEKGSGGLETPDKLERRAERIEKWLDDLAEGRARLGRAAGGVVAAINQPVGVVAPDPLGVKVSVTGFRRGFR